jgi:threonine dehydrogenase-like Zn-dependent dehydrogenase
MRRLMMVDIHRLELREGPEPAPPGPAEVALRVEASGLGRTQMHRWRLGSAGKALTAQAPRHG